jgi:hypothetical protein
MANCPNCGHETRGGMKFCPECGQDLTVSVPKDERIPTEEVPVPPPPTSGDQGRSESTSAPFYPSGAPAGGSSRRKWLIPLLGCGGLLGLLLVAVLVVAIVSAPSNNQASQSSQSGGEQENADQKKKKSTQSNSDPQDVTVAVGETATLRDRTLVVNEVERNFLPPNRFSRVQQPGNEFVRVNITLKNTGNQAFSVNPFDFEVQDSSGVQKKPTTMSDLPDPIDLGDLASGGTLDGNVVFEAPQGDNGLNLLYETDIIQRRTVTVPLS